MLLKSMLYVYDSLLVTTRKVKQTNRNNQIFSEHLLIKIAIFRKTKR